MAKLIILRGLPSSGKSTKAKELVAEGNTIRINKDLLREMLHIKWTGINEGLTKDASRALAKTFLAKNKRVVIDDTNLNEGVLQGWKDLAKELNATIEIIDIDTPVEECIIRDSKREKQVGKSVIVGMAMQYGLYELPNEKVVISDIDGTVANIDHRLQYVTNGKKDWKSFFDKMIFDEPRWEVINKLMIFFNNGYKIFFVSGRPDNYRKETENWLNMYFNGWEALLMRKAGSHEEDYLVKRRIFETYFKNPDKIKYVFDDRPQVIVNCWTPILGSGKIADVGNNLYFAEERKELDYWTNKG